MFEFAQSVFRPLLAAVNLQSLAVVSFIESIFFPIPPDTILMPLALRAPSTAFLAALVATGASVAGAAVGYVLGLKGGRPVLMRFASAGRIEKVESLYQRYDVWTIFIAGFTPIPYKVFAISSGVFGLSFTRFIAASLVGRFSRFMLEALLVAAYGEQMMALLEEHFGVITAGLAVFLLFAWWVWWTYLRPRFEHE